MTTNGAAPCAACRFLRSKCTEQCIFARYFPSPLTQKFVNVHKVFRSSNVSRLLLELPPERRQDAVDSLIFEAEARMRDPMYAIIPQISQMQKELRKLQNSLFNARADLKHYMRLANIPGPLPEYFVPPEAFGLNPHPIQNPNEEYQLVNQQQQQQVLSVGVQTGVTTQGEEMTDGSMNNFNYNSFGRFDPPRSELALGTIGGGGGSSTLGAAAHFGFPNVPAEEVNWFCQQDVQEQPMESSMPQIGVSGATYDHDQFVIAGSADENDFRDVANVGLAQNYTSRDLNRSS